MKFTVALVAFFGTLAIGQNKPMTMDTESEQNIKYVFDYGIKDQEYSLPVVNIDRSELTQFCVNVGDADGTSRTPWIIENYGDDDDPTNLYFTCLIADDIIHVPTTVSTEDTHVEFNTYTEDIPSERENLFQTKRRLIIASELEPKFYYIFYYGNKEKETAIAAPVHSMSDLNSFCKHPLFWGRKQLSVKIIERDDDPGNVYFICESPKEDTDVPMKPTVPTPAATTEQNKPVVDPKFEQKFYYISKFGDKDTGVTIKLTPVKRMSDLSVFCENEVIRIGEKRRPNIIEVNDDPRKVYFTCVIADNTDDPETTPKTPEYKPDKPTTNPESTPATEPGNTDPTVVPYKFVGEGYKYHPLIDGWMKVYLMPEDWHEARLRCLHEGSTLASPIDPAMLEVMKGLLAHKVSVAFTGISADYAPGHFYSVEGVPLDDIPAAFVPGAPDLTEDSDGCIGMYPNGSLTILHCDTPKPFVCYVKDSDVPEIQSPCGSDPDYVFESRTGKCYKFHTFGKTWSSAFMTCGAEGGHLAIINSDLEARALVDLVKKVPTSAVRSDYPDITLLGFRDWSEHKTWMTIHGESLQKAGYSRWGPGEPSDPRSEFCGAMFRDGELNDTLCGSPMPFLCEKKPAGPIKRTSSSDKGFSSVH